VPDNPGRADFEPFYDRIAGYGPAPFLIKIALSVLLGAPFFFGASKLLGVLISSAMLALYFATETFRGTLPYMALKLDPHANDALLERIRQVLSDRLFMVGAIGFGILNFCVGLLLGAPGSGWTLALTYAGYLVAGFSCGMPVVGICGVVRTIDRFAELKPKLDYTAPDRCGGIGAIRVGDDDRGSDDFLVYPADTVGARQRYRRSVEVVLGGLAVSAFTDRRACALGPDSGPVEAACDPRDARIGVAAGEFDRAD
jgi:hypothetical protein